MKRLCLVDGNALLHRAFHATPPLTTSKGELINAVFGFSSMLLKALDDLKPDFIAVAWDEKGPTFRHAAYTQYKATRGPADDSLSSQYSRVHEVLKSLNIPEFSVAGFEADDLIGTLATQAKKEKNLEIIVLTGDRDIMQIIDKSIKVLMPKKTLTDVGLYGLEEFREKWGFEPKQLTDYKALAGDASDNIPGVPGIGDIGATKLVKQFKTIETLYRPGNLKTLPERMRNLLSEGAESAAMSKQLATLDLESPIKLDLSACLVHDFNLEKAKELFEELEFKSLINRLPGAPEKTGKTQGSGESDNPAIRSFDNLSHSESFQNKTITNLDLAVTPVLQKMSTSGVMIDLKFLEKLGKDLKAKLVDLEKQIYSNVGHEFNINSPKQLAEVLFDDLKLQVIRKTKTGRSTDEATLTELYSANPVIPHLLEYRQLFKLISTYIDALPKYADKGGRVHSTFNVEGAATGRLSSQNPNLQNIPIRGTLGSEIRKAFVAPKDKVLIDADYSQLELRILAHLTGDEALINAFKNKEDIHSATAAKIFNVPIEKITKEQRMVGKTMNFATLYGQGAHALSRQLGIDYTIAKQYIDEYFARFPKVRSWMSTVLEKAYKDGFVETIWGRRRYILELVSQNRMLKAFGERAAINHPVQGTNADMIKRAMVEIDKKIDNKKCQLILQVHDELMFECEDSPKLVEEMVKMIKEKMEKAIELSVPILVEVKVGKNWGEMSPLKIAKDEIHR